MGMSLNKKDYEEIYFGKDVPPYELFINEPTSDEDFLMNYTVSKLWRLNNLYTVVNKKGKLVSYIMNRAQHIVFSNHMEHPRILILKSRQRGISTHYLLDYLDDALFIDNSNIGMQSYGLEESAALLKRLDVAWDNFPAELKEFMGLRIIKSNTKALGFSNGSQVKVQTSFRGDTLQGLHVSELGKIANKNPQKATELKAGTLQALAVGLRAAIESTAEGQHNAFYDWWFAAVGIVGARSLKDFLPVFLSWTDDPDCVSNIPQLETQEHTDYFLDVETYIREETGDKEWELTKEQRWWVISQMRELGDLFNQEYPYSPEIAFASVKDGTYYAREWRKSGTIYNPDEHGGVTLYDPALPVYTSWDLGLRESDTGELGFWQIAGHSLRLIDYVYGFGEGLDYYVSEMDKRPYRYARNALPHDIKVREIGNKAQSRLNTIRKLGLERIKVVESPPGSKADGINMVRLMIPHLVIDASKCGRVIEMFGRYTKQWDSQLGVFKDIPLHDKWSNPADMVRCFAMSGFYRPPRIAKEIDINEGRKNNASEPVSGFSI